MRTIEYNGVEVEYDERRTKSYKWQKDVMSGDMSRGMRAIEQLLCGRDEEYAEMLGDSADEMQKLIAACMADMGSAEKN